MKALGKYCDFDYRHKLSKEDDEYLQKFINEYYLGFNLKDPDALHDESYHKQLYKDAHARRNDILHQKNLDFIPYDELDKRDDEND